jgi:hypothetical protein
MLGIFAVVGVLVIGFAVAVAMGLVNLGELTNFKNAASSTQPTTKPAETDAAQDPDAAVVAMENQGYKAGMIYLSATDATVEGPHVRIERLSSTPTWGRRGGAVVDPKNMLPQGTVRGWTGPEDSATWTFNCPKAGKYSITFTCTSGGGHGGVRGVAGGKFNISSGSSRITPDIDVDVRGRHNYSFAWHEAQVGEIDLAEGQVSLKIQPAEKDTNLLAIRSVRLYPAE